VHTRQHAVDNVKGYCIRIRICQRVDPVGTLLRRKSADTDGRDTNRAAIAYSPPLEYEVLPNVGRISNAIRMICLC
jgi:hypothetical protein